MHVSITMEPEEVLDHVDAMLAWEAIASEQKGHLYSWSAMKRAEPLIRIDADTWGVLTPSSVEVEVDDGETDYATSDQEHTDWYEKVVGPQLLQTIARVRPYTTIAELDPRIDRVLRCGDMAAGDASVGDLIDETIYWRGVQYEMDSFYELHRELAKKSAAQLRLPQTARFFFRDRIIAFHDGRSVSVRSRFAYWGGRFFDYSKKRKPFVIRDDDGSNAFAPDLQRLVAACLLGEKRDRQFTVELCLGPKRTGIGLSTDAIGARAFVTMLGRERTAKGRRAALVHWVREHMRRRRRDDSAPTVKVRAHTRGVETVSAGRYHARIWPSRIPTS